MKRLLNLWADVARKRNTTGNGHAEFNALLLGVWIGARLDSRDLKEGHAARLIEDVDEEFEAYMTAFMERSDEPDPKYWEAVEAATKKAVEAAGGE